jgi:hypothetical protein
MDRLLTEQEKQIPLRDTLAKMFQFKVNEQAAYNKADWVLAARDKEWQEKINRLQQFLFNEYHILFTAEELLEAMK